MLFRLQSRPGIALSAELLDEAFVNCIYPDGIRSSKAGCTKHSRFVFFPVTQFELEIEGSLRQLWLRIVQDVSFANWGAKWMVGSW